MSFCDAMVAANGGEKKFSIFIPRAQDDRK